MANTREPGKNRPTYIDPTERTEARKDELANPTLVDLSEGGNLAGSNAGAIGVHTADTRTPTNADSGFGNPAGPLLSQHVGLNQMDPTDLVLTDSVPVAYRQATIDLAPGELDPGTGTYNISGNYDQTILAGSWFWGALEPPFGVRVPDLANSQRVTADGQVRGVAL